MYIITLDTKALITKEKGIAMKHKEEEFCEFEREFDRAGTHDLKWRKEGVEAYLSQPVREDMIPMWIADTDFGCMTGIDVV